MNFTSDYMSKMYDPQVFQVVVRRVCERLLALQKVTPFQAIAFRGMSGAAIAYPVSFHTGISLICVRKEASHGKSVEGNDMVPVKKYLIIDDFISTGETVKAIMADIRTKAAWMCATPPECVGIMLYNDQGDCKNSFDGFKVWNV